MNEHKRLLLANKAWVQDKLDLRSDFFEQYSEAQQPEFLWIGCSDSRVPAEEITGTGPGELFVHRNVANLVVHTDFNSLGVIQYAVEALKVKHIIVCGHYNCGGVRASISHTNLGMLNKWLRYIKDVYRLNRSELDQISDFNERANRLSELNVIEQVTNLTNISFIQKVWKQETRPQIHGWIYCLETGVIKELITLNPGDQVDEIYRFDLPDGDS